MTKQLLIPSALLLASGCTTSTGDFASDELAGAEASTKDSVGFPNGEEGLNLEAIVEPVIEAFSNRDFVEELVDASYAMPEMAGVVSPSDSLCADSPHLTDDLMVLESAGSTGLRHRWGWEIEISDCVIGDESFSGVMRFSYAELASVPSLMRDGVAVQVALDSVITNANGLSSLLYELDLSSSDTNVYVTGAEFGPEEFLAVDFRAFLVDVASMSTSEVISDSVVVQGGVAGTPPEEDDSPVVSQLFDYHRSPAEIALEDGDLSRVTIGTEGLMTRLGASWPHQGIVEGVVRGNGITPVLVKFTESTPVDGTVEVKIPGGWVLHTLSMD